MDKKFHLRYLPMFEQDMSDIHDYIAVRLQNPQAAQRLIDDVETAIHRRLLAPLNYAPYRSAKERDQPYYTILVRNYTVFYVVIDDVMEVRRVMYSRRNLADLV
jgi:plasmid stabilization system protein ParE